MPRSASCGRSATRSAIAASGELAAGRVLTVSAGDAAKLDRETVLHVGAAAEHRLGGRHARTLAIWLTPLADVLDGGVEAVAELVARGVVEGSFEPKTLYRDRDDGRRRRRRSSTS